MFNFSKMQVAQVFSLGDVSFSRAQARESFEAHLLRFSGLPSFAPLAVFRSHSGISIMYE